jgi:hypothetical protein
MHSRCCECVRDTGVPLEFAVACDGKKSLQPLVIETDARPTDRQTDSSGFTGYLLSPRYALSPRIAFPRSQREPFEYHSLSLGDSIDTRVRRYSVYELSVSKYTYTSRLVFLYGNVRVSKLKANRHNCRRMAVGNTIFRGARARAAVFDPGVALRDFNKNSHQSAFRGARGLSAGAIAFR